MVQRQILTSSGFDRDLKQLTKKHRELPKTIEQALLNAANCPIPPGDRIPLGLSDVYVYKMRVPCGNSGKRGAARLIYYRAENLVLALYLYAKNDIADIPANEIRSALKDAGLLPEIGDQAGKGVPPTGR